MSGILSIRTYMKSDILLYFHQCENKNGIFFFHKWSISQTKKMKPALQKTRADITKIPLNLEEANISCC